MQILYSACLQQCPWQSNREPETDYIQATVKPADCHTHPLFLNQHNYKQNPCLLASVVNFSTLGRKLTLSRSVPLEAALELIHWSDHVCKLAAVDVRQKKQLMDCQLLKGAGIK